MSKTEPNSENQKSAFEKQWHHQPNVPLKVAPYWSWPPNPADIFNWVAKRWLNIAENTIILGLSLLCWVYFQPSLESAMSFHWQWMGEILVRNYVLMVLVAGGLHLYFFSWKKQKLKLKFDGRDLRPKGKAFTFNSQVLDNMVWTLGSGVPLWTAFECLMFWAMANGYAPVVTWNESPVWFAALFFLTPIWISFHFYWVHRFLHWPPLYRVAHALHHRNTNIGPWSGLSMHPIEHILFFSSVLIHFVVPAHSIHILFHMQHQSLTAATSHTGFEGLIVRDKNRLALGTFHHQMHHRYFECNYGNLEVPWDKLFGSFHDGTEEAHEKIMNRRTAMMMNEKA